MFIISMWTAEYSVFEPILTSWFSWYFTFNLFRAKADERKPQYWLLLLNKGWIYLTFFSSCWIVQPQYFCSSSMIQPWKNCERAIVTSRPEEDDGTKPWKELNDTIYGITTPKKIKVCKSHLVIHEFSICLDLFGVNVGCLIINNPP